MCHSLPTLRQAAFAWLRHALALVGLLALLALPFGGWTSFAPFHHAPTGIGKLVQALPAELRTARPAAPSPDKVPGTPAPASLPPAATSLPNVPQAGAVTPALGPRRLANAPFARPSPRAPPVSI